MIVDDERAARENLRLLIDNYCDGVEVAWEASDVENALIILERTKPDLLFLDIEMPGRDGLDLAYSIIDRNIPIVFVTAYSQYTLNALRLGAIDYLLKPFPVAELREAILRVNTRQQEKNWEQHSMDTIMRLMQGRVSKQGKLTLPQKGGFKVVDPNTILYVESDKSYSTLFLDDQRKFVVSKNLRSIECLLKGWDFFRIHNSYLINLNFLTDFTSYDGGVVTLSNGKELPVSRRRIHDFKKTFAELSGHIDEE